MQFAGQRTDLSLKPIGKPDNFLIRLSEDILSEPEAVLIHGISPQKTLAEGITEAEAVKYLTSQVFFPDTIVVGFNNIRFDDEFIRFLFWRNFADAYEWHYKDARSRWDLLDLTRMTRALRPDGIHWPFAPDGKPSNRLELLTSVNKLDHVDAHDALSDVKAAISIARLIRNKQTRLFDYLLKMRDKTRVAVLVGKKEPFVYTSGRYPSEFEKTTVVVQITAQPGRDVGLVYDLRINPDEFIKLTPAQLAKLWQLRGPEAPYFPVKKLSYNRCPAVAPIGTLDSKSANRLQLDPAEVNKNLTKLAKAQDFGDKLVAALEIIEPPRQGQLIVDEQTVDAQLYDDFIKGPDKTRIAVVRAAEPDELSTLKLDFADERLKLLLPLYKARNFPKSLTKDEKQWWRNFKKRRLADGGRLDQNLARIEELASWPGQSPENQVLLAELKSYTQSLASKT